MTPSLTRRDWLRLGSAGVLGGSLSGWFDLLASRAAAQPGPAKPKACILLWMDGGPSHKDTFDLKPGTKDAGDFQPIATSVPGLRISEHLGQIAKVMHHGAVIRGMSTGEGAHGRAKYYLHTGYKEGQGGLTHPSLGAIVASELGRFEASVPNYVAIGGRSYGAGYLGSRFHPLHIADASRGVENLKSAGSDRQFAKRLSILDELEASFHRDYQAPIAKDHETTYRRAVELMRSKEAKAFDLAAEPAASRSAYGEGRFAEGCLLARRLIEVGVTFVEVGLGGWDTHIDNFDRVKRLSGQIDRPMARLIQDLADRGLLDSTLIVWMGEFGRTPKINTRGEKPGRDHYPKAWSSVLFGGGIKAGQVIGKTDAEGAAVVERPVSTLDFMATICTILGINFAKELQTAIGRPMRLVDKGGKPIRELLSS